MNGTGGPTKPLLVEGATTREFDLIHHLATDPDPYRPCLPQPRPAPSTVLGIDCPAVDRVRAFQASLVQKYLKTAPKARVSGGRSPFEPIHASILWPRLTFYRNLPQTGGSL